MSVREMEMSAAILFDYMNMLQGQSLDRKSCIEIISSVKVL